MIFSNCSKNDDTNKIIHDRCILLKEPYLDSPIQDIFLQHRVRNDRLEIFQHSPISYDSLVYVDNRLNKVYRFKSYLDSDSLVSILSYSLCYHN